MQENLVQYVMNIRQEFLTEELGMQRLTWSQNLAVPINKQCCYRLNNLITRKKCLTYNQFDSNTRNFWLVNHELVQLVLIAR